MDTERRTPCDDGRGDWNGVFKDAKDQWPPPEVRREGWERFSLWGPKKEPTLPTL